LYQFSDVFVLVAHTSSIQILAFRILQYWGLNQGLHACQASIMDGEGDLIANPEPLFWRAKCKNETLNLFF
jgi:hypothetical protein